MSAARWGQSPGGRSDSDGAGRLRQVLAHFGVDAPPGSRGMIVCPFHGDVNASLSLDFDRGLWHCFGCDRGGDWANWIMEEIGAASFGDAERYAASVGIGVEGAEGEARGVPQSGRWGQGVLGGAGAFRGAGGRGGTRVRW